MPHDVLKFSDRITALPIIHGSGDCALEVRRMLLENRFECVALPLPSSFQENVELAVHGLPTATMVTQAESPRAWNVEWSPDNQTEEDEQPCTLNYVPVDPCQSVIAAIRIAIGEHIPREFIDLETERFRPQRAVLPDPYALKKVSVERFGAALLPAIDQPPAGQQQDRIHHMACRLRELEERYQSILFVVSVLDWPWVRDAYIDQLPCPVDHDEVEPTQICQPANETLIFMFGELPFITSIYERARAELENDENLSIDGVKELLVSARTNYLSDRGRRARKITPHLLSVCLKYIRNVSLMERRVSPDLYTIVVAAKQILGDQFALHVAQTARQYEFARTTSYEQIMLGIEQARLEDGEIVKMVSRLPGPPVEWRSCQLRRRPNRAERERWQMRWNPLAQCSWPPEDDRIENFRSHVFDRAQALMGADLARSEKFTTSVKDGVDVRETLRNWHTGDIFVKELPPGRGDLGCAVMLFDVPADPRDYPWRTTWYAEHDDESTLAFFASDFRQEMIGPGIGLATYGGGLFLYPPVSIPDIWNDPTLDFTETLEERLLAAACVHSPSRHIALLSPSPPGAGWRRLASRFNKRWIPIPLGQFSDSTVEQLRMVHVLNGHQVRSFAAHFITKA